MNKHVHYTYLFCSLLFAFLVTGKALACTGRDIIFTNITVTSVSSDSYQYSYEIKNIGTQDITFNKLSIQNYVSTDDQVGSDAAGGGATISQSSQEILSPGETYSGINTVYPFPQNPQSTYPYIIAHVYIYGEDECDETNNYMVKLIQVTTSLTSSSHQINATVNWIADSKSFIVKNWPGNNYSLNYSVYTSSGILMLAGNTQKNQSTPLNSLQNGYYILYLSDGEKIYSQKIIY